MSMTRETRRERLERLSSVPDAHIRILWGRVWGLILGIGSLIGGACWLAELGWRAAGL